MDKIDLNKLLKKYQPVMKKTGKQVSKALRVAEEDVVKMYKIAQVHVELQMKNLQKERIYHDIGKCVAQKLMNGELENTGLEKFKKQLDKIDAEGKKIKKRLTGINKPEKKKSSSKKTKKNQDIRDNI